MARLFPGDVPRNLLAKYGELGRKVIELWEEVRRSAQSDPKPHHLTHMVGGSDQFPRPDPPKTVLVGGTHARGRGPGFMRADAQLITDTGTPSGLANANTAGSSTAAPRLDHQHKRDVRVRVNGTEVGTRNSIDFQNSVDLSFQGSDDSAADAVHVIATRPTAFFGTPQDAWFTPEPLIFYARAATAVGQGG